MRLFRGLIRFYPASFRAEYGEELCATLARERGDAAGVLGVMSFWAGAIADTVVNAARIHGDILGHDLRYAARTLRRSRGFTVTAIVVAALGIGATTAAFSVTDHVLIRPLPFPDADRVVRLWENRPGYSRMELSPANFRDWRRVSRAFEGMAAYTSVAMNLSGRGEPERLEGSTVSANLFPLLGLQPLLGRGFSEEEDREAAPGTLLLSHGLWQARFGADPGVVGARILLDDSPYLVLGVMPPEVHFPRRRFAGFWTALRLAAADFEDRNDNYLEVVARLRDGVSVDQARADMELVAARLEREYPIENARTGATVNRLRDELSSQSRLLLAALVGASICVLLIACTNLASLLMTRSLARERELAVRTAVGAGRERLVRQMLTESLIVSAVGGVLGVAVAIAAAPLAARLVPTSLPIAETPDADLRMLLFAALITVATGVGFGVAPALRSSRLADATLLREGSRAGTSRRVERLRALLVTAEVTASVVLLVSTGLLVRAMWRVQQIDPGFRSEGVLTLRTALPMPRYARTEAREQFYRRVVPAIEALPGVDRAAYISFLPMGMTGGIWPVALEGQPRVREEARVASLRFVTPGFFETLAIPLRAGRDLSESDTARSPFVAVVSESFARRYWPGEDPLGRRFQFAFFERTVVGVVGDVRVRGLERASEPQVYLPSAQVPDNRLVFYGPKDLVIKSSLPPATLVPAVRRIIETADPRQPISDVRMLDAILEGETGARRAHVRVLGSFAAIAFLLAAIGIHGLLAFGVSQRAREIGVRIALGAERRDILALVVRRGALLAVTGVGLGAALALAAGRALETLLAGVSPGDAPTFGGAIGLCLLMAMAGSLVPALRAVRVDPVEVMRVE